MGKLSTDTPLALAETMGVEWGHGPYLGHERRGHPMADRQYANTGTLCPVRGGKHLWLAWGSHLHEGNPEPRTDYLCYACSAYQPCKDTATPCPYQGASDGA